MLKKYSKKNNTQLTHPTLFATQNRPTLLRYYCRCYYYYINLYNIVVCAQDAPYLRDVVVLETMEDMDKESHTKAANKKTLFCQYNFFNFTATLAKTRCTVFAKIRYKIVVKHITSKQIVFSNEQFFGVLQKKVIQHICL